MGPQQDRNDRYQHPAGRVVGGQQQARVRPVQGTARDGPADHPRQAEAHQDHAELQRTSNAQDDPGQRDHGEGVARAGDHHTEPEPAECLVAGEESVALDRLAQPAAPFTDCLGRS
jgi:hypothetical protein